MPSAPEIRCPVCRGALQPTPDGLTCEGCARRYAVAEGIPLLIAAELSGQQEHQKEYFDAEFREYHEYAPERWRVSFNERIFSALDLPGSGGPFLDVGVGGSGATVIEAARMGISAAGCDLSVPGIRSARRFADSEGVGKSVTLVACAAESLPFADGAFASASIVAVLEHLDNDGEAARELARVIRPGGRVWVTVPHAYRHIPLPLWPWYMAHDRRIGHKRHYDSDRLTSLMTAAGFELVGVAYSGHPVKVAQLAVDRVVPAERRESLWWKLESRDHRKGERPRGAIQLSAVFERP
jgi:ubiquinone/menaquinone biosynthesis C-methylase UbiE